MRIGMIFSTPFPPQEGIGFYVWNLSRWLVSQGHEVHLITRGGLFSDQYITPEGIFVWKPCFLPLYPFHVQFHNLFVNRLTHQLENKLDLFHLHSPLVKMPQTGLPTIATIHTPIKGYSRAVKVSDIYSLLIKLQTPFSLRVETELMHRVHRLTTVANTVRREFTEYGINPQRVAVLGNGVDIDLFKPAQILMPNDQPMYVLTVGRLAPRKGLEDLIQSAKIVLKYHPNLRFIVLGEGPLRPNLQRLVTQLNLKDSVFLLGHVHQRTRLISYYQHCMMYVHPSHYEGLPTSLLEAMACGRPVIAAAVSGNLDIIENQKNGLLVPPHQPEQLADAILNLIAKPTLAQQMGIEARATVCNHYSWDVVGKRYLQEYQVLLGESKK